MAPPNLDEITPWITMVFGVDNSRFALCLQCLTLFWNLQIGALACPLLSCWLFRYNCYESAMACSSSLLEIPSVPIQKENSNDCGVYVCYSALHECKNLWTENESQENPEAGIEPIASPTSERSNSGPRVKSFLFSVRNSTIFFYALLTSLWKSQEGIPADARIRLTLDILYCDPGRFMRIKGEEALTTLERKMAEEVWQGKYPWEGFEMDLELSSFACLQPGNELNDAVLNYFLALLQKSLAAPKRALFLSTFLLPKLKKDNEFPTRWLLKLLRGGSRRVLRIFIPVNRIGAPGHWVLIGVDLLST